MFSILVLFPAAIVISIAAYKLKNHVKHSMITHVEGCNFGSLFWGGVITALGTVAVLGIVGGAYSTGTAVLAAQNNPNTAIVSFSSGANGSNSLSVTPGPVLGAIALVFSVLSSALLLAVWFAFPWVRALPGFGPPSCCTSSTPIQSRGGFINPVASSAAATSKVGGMGGGGGMMSNPPMVGVMMPTQPSLPPGWSIQGPTQNGDYWYLDPAGVSHWDYPRA